MPELGSTTSKKIQGQGSRGGRNPAKSDVWVQISGIRVRRKPKRMGSGSIRKKNEQHHTLNQKPGVWVQLTKVEKKKKNADGGVGGRQCVKSCRN